MSQNEIEAMVSKMQEWEELSKEAAEQAEALRDKIKAEMLKRGTEELTAGKFIIRWTSVLSQRFDSTALKKVLPEIYKAYLKQVSSRRFTVSV